MPHEQQILNAAIDEICALYATNQDGRTFIGGTIPIDRVFPAIHDYESRSRLTDRIKELIEHIGSDMDAWWISTHTRRGRECLSMIRLYDIDEDEVEVVVNLVE